MSRFVGVDLHKNMFTVSYFNPGTGKHQLKGYPIQNIGSFIKELNRDDTVGVESTNNTRYFVNQIRDCVKEVKVINPSQFKVISKSVKKTDKNDAKVIAEFLSKDMVPEVRMKDKKNSADKQPCEYERQAGKTSYSVKEQDTQYLKQSWDTVEERIPVK